MNKQLISEISEDLAVRLEYNTYNPNNVKHKVILKELLNKYNVTLDEYNNSKENNLIVESTQASTDAEKVLEILMNIGKIKSVEEMAEFLSSKDANAVFLRDYYIKFKKTNGMVDDESKTYYDALQQIQRNVNASNAKQLGSSKYSTTKEWQSFGGSNSSTSKTDVVSSKYKFSIKNGKEKVRVLDGSLPQTKALILSTIQSVGLEDQLKSKIETHLKSIEDLWSSEDAKMSRLLTGTKLGLGEMRKVADEHIQEIVKKFDENTQNIRNEMEGLFATLDSNMDYKYAFAYESITGELMFGNSEGTANMILAWSPDFKIIKTHDMSSTAKAIAAKFKTPSVGTKSANNSIFKTAAMLYTTDELQKVEIPKELEGINEIYNEMGNLFEEGIKLENDVKSGLLTEVSIKDTIKKILDKIINASKRMFNKVKDLVLNMYKYLSEGLMSFLNFAGIDLQISINQEDVSLNLL